MQQRGEAIREAKRAFKIDLFFSVFFIVFIEKIFCFGIFCFLRTESMSEDAPNNPVNNGRRGCWTGRFNEERPRKPARRKIMSARYHFFFSK